MSELQSDSTPLVLIVDDDRTMRSLLNLAMEEEGYRVAEAENGQQCLAEYTYLKPDLILLDAVMPDIDGFTCCQKIRSLPGGDRLPILIITVLDDQESVEQAFETGATDYITKPIHWSVLSQRVRRLLDGERAWTELNTIKEKADARQDWTELVSTALQQLVSGNRSNNSIQQILDSIQEWLAASKIVLYQGDGRQYSTTSATKYNSVKNFSDADLNLITEFGEQYSQGIPIAIEDLSQADLPSSLINQFKQVDTKSLFILPIKRGKQILGLLMIHFSQSSLNHRLEDNRGLDLANLLTIVITNNQ
ncbi:response regulator [Waterburya agarophytonicola K14]|uniref:Response regulator n=1 Tax=Waterburya agarophytonicola KI4 TaxID=2874699 RepID=A0A964BV66_9CYAN|nr:response regulator [Waterburya agarophytonicola]MCC0179227.1 response regulator [Waterburya agarophytonicola KI4]